MNRLPPLVLAVALLAAVPALTGGRPGPQATGAIRGRIAMTDPAAAGTLKVTADQATCGQEVPDESIVVSPDGGIAHTVVVLEGSSAPVRSNEPSLVNRGCQFVPHVQVAQPGARLQVSSDDDTLHTTHAYAENGDTLFNIAIPAPGQTIARPLTRTGVVRFECDSHRWMRGFVYVTDALAVVTAVDGVFELDAVPAGVYTLRVWHERLSAAPREVRVAAGDTLEVEVTLEP